MIIVKYPFHQPLLADKQFALTMLNSIFPPPPINIPIRPKHLSIALLNISLEKSLVAAPRSPRIDSIAPFLILFKVAFIVLLLRMFVLQFAGAFAFPFSKLSSIEIAISPVVLTESTELSILEIPPIDIPILVF